MVVLRGIPRILSPQLLNVLARMGHGDEIVLADANFPSVAIARSVGVYTLLADSTIVALSLPPPPSYPSPYPSF